MEPGERRAAHAAHGLVVRAAPARTTEQMVARRVFGVWTIIYAIVGAQMGWILWPFIGAPNVPLQLLRARESNFFVVFFEQLHRLLFG
jgi:hypothetical protein